MTSPNWVGHGTSYGIIEGLARAAERESAHVQGDTVAFPAARGVGVLLIVCAAFMAALAGFSAFSATAPWWIPVLFLGIGSFAFLGWPRRVVVNSEGIRQRRIFGNWKSIAWRSLTALNFRQRDLVTFACGADGTKIAHSPYHVDRNRFHAEVARRSGLSNILHKM